MHNSTASVAKVGLDIAAPRFLDPAEPPASAPPPTTLTKALLLKRRMQRAAWDGRLAITEVGSERSYQAPKYDDGHECDECSDDPDHDDVEVALGMRRTTDREQGHYGAVVGQAVQRASADDRHPM